VRHQHAGLAIQLARHTVVEYGLADMRVHGRKRVVLQPRRAIRTEESARRKARKARTRR
jgi:hypothetical protein